MKGTAVIWNEFTEGLRFFHTIKDVTEFNDVFINSCDSSGELQNSLNDFVYSSEGNYKVSFCRLPEFEKVVRDGYTIIHCGFVP